MHLLLHCDIAQYLKIAAKWDFFNDFQTLSYCLKITRNVSFDWLFFDIFCQLLSSLRSHNCKMRLFLWFSNTVHCVLDAILCSKVVFRPQSKYLAWCLSKVQKVEGNFKDFNVVNIGKTSKDYEEKQICFDHLLPCLLFHVNHFSLQLRILSVQLKMKITSISSSVKQLSNTSIVERYASSTPTF